MEAIRDEMESLMTNHTRDLVSLAPNKKALKNRWVYKLKAEASGKKRYKSKLVVKGYNQQKVIDFIEMFS
jgi:hypothetical protein